MYTFWSSSGQAESCHRTHPCVRRTFFPVPEHQNSGCFSDISLPLFQWDIGIRNKEVPIVFEGTTHGNPCSSKRLAIKLTLQRSAQSDLTCEAARSDLTCGAAQSDLTCGAAQSDLTCGAAQSDLTCGAAQSDLTCLSYNHLFGAPIIALSVVSICRLRIDRERRINYYNCPFIR